MRQPQKRKLSSAESCWMNRSLNYRHSVLYILHKKPCQKIRIYFHKTSPDAINTDQYHRRVFTEQSEITFISSASGGSEIMSEAEQKVYQLNDNTNCDFICPLFRNMLPFLLPAVRTHILRVNKNSKENTCCRIFTGNVCILFVLCPAVKPAVLIFRELLLFGTKSGFVYAGRNRSLFILL